MTLVTSVELTAGLQFSGELKCCEKLSSMMLFSFFLELFIKSLK